MAISSSTLTRVAALAVLLGSHAVLSQAVPGGPLPAPVPLFPPNEWWNVDVSAVPLDPYSAAFINFIGSAKGPHPGFGGDSSPYPEIYGFPCFVVSGSEPLVPGTFDYADESDVGAPGRPPGYPIPPKGKTQPKWIEGGYPGSACVGGDKHLLIVDKDNRLLFETFDTRFNVPLNSWEADSMAGALPMGARLRLKASKDISGHAAPVQKIPQAMKTHGPIVADNGSDMDVQGTYDTRWDNSLLNPAFSSLQAGDFEVVQLGWQPTIPPIPGCLAFYTLTPCRIVDTRLPAEPFGGPALSPGLIRLYVLTGSCQIPANAVALLVNTAVVAGAEGHLTLFPGNSPNPGSSNLNFSEGQTRSNNALLFLVTDLTGTVAVLKGSCGSNHFILDANGYFR